MDEPALYYRLRDWVSELRPGELEWPDEPVPEADGWLTQTARAEGSVLDEGVETVWIHRVNPDNAHQWILEHHTLSETGTRVMVRRACDGELIWTTSYWRVDG